jgi:TRAP-type mannitol/chloroaromatic compound transport system substrate-binding protein
MRRREFLRAVGAGFAASALASPAVAQSMPELKWRMTTSWPKSLDTVYGACEEFAKRVAEITDNRFQIQVFAAGEIVPGLQVLDAVQNGTVEMGGTNAYYYWGKDPSFALATGIPFGLNARQQDSWQQRGGGIELLDGLFADFGCYGLQRRADGRLVPQGDQHRCRSQRIEIPHRRLRRQRYQASRGRAAAGRARRYISGP